MAGTIFSRLSVMDMYELLWSLYSVRRVGDSALLRILHVRGTLAVF